MKGRTEEHKKKEKKKRNKLIILFIVLLLIPASFYVYAHYDEWFGDTSSTQEVSHTSPELSEDIGSIDENATKFVEDDIVEEISNTISVPGYPSEIYLEGGATETHIELVNPEKNTVYFKFKISIGEMNGDRLEEIETLYESGLVKPGQVIKRQTLSRPLASGKYDGSIAIQTYSLDTEKEMNGARTITQFIVE